MSTSETRTLTCPTCETETHLVQVDRNGVLIDACPSCRGIWLDRGELDKLIELEAAQNEDFLAEVRGDSRREDDQPSSHHGGDKHGGGHGGYGQSGKRKKRGGFLGDLLDLG